MKFTIYDRDNHSYYTNTKLNEIKFTSLAENAKLLSEKEAHKILLYLQEKYPYKEYIIITEIEIKKIIDYHNFEQECNKKISNSMNEDCVFYIINDKHYYFIIKESDDICSHVHYFEGEIYGDFYGKYRLKKDRHKLINKIEKAIKDNEETIKLLLIFNHCYETIKWKLNGWEDE